MTDVPQGHRPLAGSERAPVAGARRRSAADPAEQMTLTVRLRRRSDAPALPDLDQLSERQTGSPPQSLVRISPAATAPTLRTWSSSEASPTERG